MDLLAVIGGVMASTAAFRFVMSEFRTIRREWREDQPPTDRTARLEPPRSFFRPQGTGDSKEWMK